MSPSTLNCGDKDIALHILGGVSLIMAAACSSDNPSEEPPIVENEEQPIPGEDDRFAPLVKLELNESQQQLSDATNRFGISMWNIIEGDAESKDGNTLFSPLSLRTALSMLANGAEGVTRTQLLELLAGKESAATVESLNNFNKDFSAALTKVDEKAQVNLANGLWIDKTIAANSAFTSALKGLYDVESVAFEKGTEQSQESINKWISDNTDGLIPQFFDTPPTSDIVLANALYFGSEWTYKFNPENTQDGYFTNADGTRSEVKMMAQTVVTSLSKTANFEKITLPYGNRGFAMEILIPVNAENAVDFSGAFEEEEGETSAYEINLKMPRFSCESELKANNILAALGFDKIVGEDGDYSGITDEAASLFTEIIQKNKIEVDEKGTRAASTTVVMEMSEGQVLEKTDITIDRPFAFAIRETSSGAILFMGKVNKL